jgi:hypothetical protein
MRERVFLLIHLFATIAKLLLPGGARSVIAESLLLKHQLLMRYAWYVIGLLSVVIASLFVSSATCLNFWTLRHIKQGHSSSPR